MKYINKILGVPIGTSARAKLEAIMKDGAMLIPVPHQFMPNLVCIVDNGAFGAAAYCDTPSEFYVMLEPDNRHKVWLSYSNAEKNSGH